MGLAVGEHGADTFRKSGPRVPWCPLVTASGPRRPHAAQYEIHRKSSKLLHQESHYNHRKRGAVHTVLLQHPTANVRTHDQSWPLCQLGIALRKYRISAWRHYRRTVCRAKGHFKSANTRCKMQMIHRSSWRTLLLTNIRMTEWRDMVGEPSKHRTSARLGAAAMHQRICVSFFFF